jgi:RNA polymerase sigma factor (sigma-70 family)
MPEVNDFSELVRRVRAGDEEAAANLVRLYEAPIRRAVRMQLRDPRLRTVLDSMDICQSVLANFFVRAASGQFDLQQPANLLNLLVTMARNKLVTHARKSQNARRDPAGFAAAVESLASSDSTPSGQVARQELLLEVRKRLSEDERHLAEQRALGLEWTEIAAQQGGSPEALRKKLGRALDRVAKELGLEDSCDE